MLDRMYKRKYEDSSSDLGSDEELVPKLYERKLIKLLQKEVNELRKKNMKLTKEVKTLRELNLEWQKRVLGGSSFDVDCAVDVNVDVDVDEHVKLEPLCTPEQDLQEVSMPNESDEEYLPPDLDCDLASSSQSNSLSHTSKKGYETSTDEESYNAFTPHKLQLARRSVKSTPQGDRLYAKNLAAALFSEEELMNSSYTGKKCTVKKDSEAKPELDRKRKKTLKKLFIERMIELNPNIKRSEIDERCSKLREYVAEKIQTLLRDRKTQNIKANQEINI